MSGNELSSDRPPRSFADDLESRARRAESLAAVLGGDVSAAIAGVQLIADATPFESEFASQESFERLLDEAAVAMSTDAGALEYIRLRESVFHPERFDPDARVLSPCESVYVAQDPSAHAELLQSLYDAHGFLTRIAIDRCCPGHVAVELEFYGNRLRAAVEAPDVIDEVREFFNGHLLQWSPLLAAVISRPPWHPVLRLAGFSLERFFRDETMLLGTHASAPSSQPVEAANARDPA